MTLSPVRLALLLLLSGLLLWIAFDLQGDRLDAVRQQRDSAQSELVGLRQAARISGDMLAARDEIDRTHTLELAHVRTENQDRRRAVDAGTQRLRVKAACPAPVPTDPGAGGVADASIAELAADARSDYFTLRDQLALTRQMVLGLQQHITRVCRR